MLTIISMMANACDNDEDDNGDGEDAGGVLVLGDVLPDASRALDTVCRYQTASNLLDI
jgi:hypothetical protein